ncbi:MAG: sugar phosphate isomerase/epimerase [Sphaerochaetaceae bacterium]|nr:sugar phosphate isomerase/epimerase [Sphaerochaetaceae bacterium]
MKVGIQLYSVRNAMEQNPYECLKEVAKAGFKYIEPANHNAQKDFGIGFGVPAKELKSVLDDYGLQVINAHVQPLDEENVKQVIEYHQILGNRSLTLPMIMYSSHEEALRIAEMIQKTGEICHENGMEYLYHNHYHEFQILDGEMVFDTLINNTSPDCVGFELDTFWTMRGGVDPIKMIHKLGTRLKKIHQKDFSKDCTQPVNMFEVIEKDANITMDLFIKTLNVKAFTEIGFGIMDIQSIIEAGNKLGSVDFIILEQDATQMPSEIESIKKSMSGFKKFSGLDFS